MSTDDPPMPDAKSPEARYRYNHVCEGCDGTFSECQPLWAQQRKCCPDCTHHRAFPKPKTK